MWLRSPLCGWKPSKSRVSVWSICSPIDLVQWTSVTRSIAASDAAWQWENQMLACLPARLLATAISNETGSPSIWRLDTATNSAAAAAAVWWMNMAGKITDSVQQPAWGSRGTKMGVDLVLDYGAVSHLKYRDLFASADCYSELSFTLFVGFPCRENVFIKLNKTIV